MSSGKTNKVKEIYYYDRQKKEMCRENVLGDGFIKWAYHTMSGKLVHPFLFNSSILSRLLGWFFDRSLSRGRIAGIVKDLEIDSSEFLLKDGETDIIGQYRSFNDFFYRRLKSDVRPFSDDENDFCCPADGRILVYPDAGTDSRFSVKGAELRLAELFGEMRPEFVKCSVAVVRLCPSDYHRYHFPCSGEIVDQGKIKGQFHSVNPTALNEVSDIFVRNKREYAILENSRVGKVGYVDVGAFGVAGIVQTFKDSSVKKMDEKGYFKFGGSTIVLVFETGKVEFCKDLVEKSAEGIETLVRAGQPLATAIK